MRRFIELLAATGSVSVAAQAVGMSRQSAYRLRARQAGQPFDAAWEAALDAGVARAAEGLLERVLHGVPVPIYYRGRQVGEKRVFNERATIRLLSNTNLFGARGPVSDYKALTDFLGEDAN